MKTLGIILLWLVGIYAALFIFWVATGLVCLENGHSVAECRDNVLTKIVSFW